MSRILIVDDEQSICWGVARLAAGMGLAADVASSAEDGLRLAAKNPPDAIVLDVRLPGMDGIAAMEKFREVVGSAPIIVISAFGDLDTAVRAVREGAFEYLIKPFDLAEIRSVIQRALHTPKSCASETELGSQLEGMLGETPVMREAFKRIALAANSDASVLLSGESGVGKELAARAIHLHSQRSEAPFVAVNVAALNSTLAESELFGHAAGAFTDAGGPRKGLLVQADGGTLFLDEVADIPLSTQVKLLRALDRREVLPVGADEPVTTRFRIISATHQDLSRLAQTGAFRHDLLYRLGAFEITLPPLRVRRDDIPLLARHFASQLGPSASLDASTIENLKSRAWPGNVRELRNAIEHALVMARTGVVLPSHLPPQESQSMEVDSAAPEGASLSELRTAALQRAEDLLRDPAASGSVYELFLEDVEPAVLNAAVDKFHRQFAPAARALGLHRTTLKRKLEQYGLVDEHDGAE